MADLMLFGEVHGTAEAPAFVAQVLAAAPAPVTLYLEWPATMQHAVNAFLRTGHRAMLIAHPARFWTYRDGRSSLAIIELLEHARELGTPVVCFDDDGDDRERRMAMRLLRARPTSGSSIVLCGNLHARTTAPWMGSYLRAEVPSLVALDLHHEEGTAWCITDAATGPAAMAATGAPLPPGIHLHAHRDADGFDGVYAVGAISASMPVR